MDHRQIATGFASVEWIQNVALAEPSIIAAQNAGYAWYVLLIRHMLPNILWSEVHDFVRDFAALVHRHGMKFYLDTDPTWFTEDVISRDKDAAMLCILPQQVDVYNGEFDVIVPGPATGRQSLLNAIPGVYKLDGTTPVNHPEILDYQYEHAMVGGNCFHLHGTVADNYTGSLKLYLLASDFGKLDHDAKALYQTIRENLLSYHDVPIDGIGWDEPGKLHGRMSYFRGGVAFFERFKRTCGYDLLDQLFWLDSGSDTPESVKVRCDYYQTLSDMHYELQKFHNDVAREVWGDQLMFGTHQTWSGLPTDIAAGVFDHFRLGTLLSEAWTDGGYDFEAKTITFPFILADSLKKGLGKPNAYYNNWLYRPDPGTCKLYNQQKMLFNINSFAMSFSDYSETLVNNRVEPMKHTSEYIVDVLDRYNQFLDGSLSQSTVAIWYGYEGYVSMDKRFARALYTFFQNSSQFLVDSSLFPDFVSSEILMASHVENGMLVTARGIVYPALVLPYARVLPTGLWEKLQEFAGAGLEVIFVGPEPKFDASGNELDFAQVTGFCSFGLDSYLKAIAQNKINLAVDAWEPAFIEANIPVKTVNAGKFVLEKDQFGTVYRAVSGKISWIMSPDPREFLIKVLEKHKNSEITVYSNRVLYRSFKHPARPEEHIVVMANRYGVPNWGVTPSCLEAFGAPRAPIRPLCFDGVIEWKRQFFRFHNCEFAAIKFKGDRIVEVLSDGGDFKVEKQ